MSKGQSKNGVRLTINNSSPYSTMIITDIDVEPGIDTVILDIGNVYHHTCLARYS